MKERRTRQKQTAFHFSWIRLPELHTLHLFQGKRIEEHVLQDHSGVRLERDNGQVIGRITVPSSPWRRLKVHLNDEKETCDLVQSSIDPSRNFSHRIAVSRQSDGSLYYSATRDMLFQTRHKPQIWYDTELQIALCEDRGRVVWSLTEFVDRSDAFVHKLFVLWHRFVKNRERMESCRNEEDRAGFHQIAAQVMQVIKETWAPDGSSSFQPLAAVNADSDLGEIRGAMRRCLPEIYYHYIDHPPEPIFFSRFPGKEFRIEVDFSFDPEGADYDQPILVRPTDNIRLIVPPETCGQWTPKRCFFFYQDVLGFLPEEARFNPDDDATKTVVVKKEEIRNSVEFWGDIAEVVQSLLIYQVELKAKLPPVIRVLEDFRDTNFAKAVLV